MGVIVGCGNQTHNLLFVKHRLILPVLRGYYHTTHEIENNIMV